MDETRRVPISLMSYSIKLFLVCISIQANAQTSTYSTKIDKFSIDVSCNAKPIIEQSKSKDVEELSCRNGEVVYTIRVSTYHNNMYNSDSLNNLDFDLDYSQRYFVNTGKFDLIGMLLKTSKGYPGKEYRFQHKFENKINFRRIYIVKNKVIELIYEAPKSKLYHIGIDAFFNSFAIDGYDSNPVPYINMPSEKEIANRPFIANFPSETRQIIEANYSDFGKIALVIEICELNPSLNKGVMGLSVLYTDFQDDMTPVDKQKMFDIHKKTQEVTFPNFKWIENNSPVNDELTLKFEYDIGNIKVIDSRKLIFDGSRLYTITGTYTKKTDPNNEVQHFIDNFKIKL